MQLSFSCAEVPAPEASERGGAMYGVGAAEQKLLMRWSLWLRVWQAPRGRRGSLLLVVWLI